MTISQNIDALPTAPTRADPASFDTRADAYLSALVTFSTQIETFRTQANTTAGDANTDATAAEAARSGAESAYASTLGAAGATYWSSATTYLAGNTVIASNGRFYRALSGSTNDNPVGSVSGAWLLLSGGAVVLNEAQTFTAAQAFSGGATVTSLKETATAIAASEIDLATGNLFTKTISTNTTFTLANVPATGTAASFILELTNGGAAAVTWWSGMKWPGGTAPTLTASGVDVLGFYTRDGGTTWRGFKLGLDSK